MPASTTPRPSQVTIAAGLVMAASVVVVLIAFDQVAGLRSAETRETVEEFVSTPLGERLGLGVQGTLSLMRVLTMVTAACATAAAILGYHVLQRSRSARLALTVLAGPLFLAGVVVGGFLPSIIAGSILMLWFQPARDWVDGKAPKPAATPPVASPPRWPPPPAPPTSPTAPTVSEPRAYAGFGGAPGEDWRTIPPGYAAPVTDPASGRVARPHGLVWSCALTWAGCAVAFVTMFASVVLMVAAPDLLMDELYRQNPELGSDGITTSTLRSTVIVVGLVVMVWSVAASVLAGFAWRGRPWARTGLVASATCASLLCLLAALGSPAMLLPLALCGVTIPLLLRPEVRAFVRRPQ